MPTNPNMVAIQTVTVGSGGATYIEFTSIPQTYTDLIIKWSARDNTNYYANNAIISFNGSTSSLSTRELYGTGSSAASLSSSEGRFGLAAANNATASTFGNSEVYIPNYTGSNNKSYSSDSVSENNGTDGYDWFYAGLWANTAAITSIRITSGSSGSFRQYSTFTLYGVYNTVTGMGAKAYGGTVTQDTNYVYHTFLASGTFTPTQSLSADILVVAGGGGGWRGGGGAGGLLGFTSQSLTATNYTVTVGAGGAQQVSGSNSQFGSLTTAIGGGRGADATNQNNNGASGGSGGGGEWNGSGGAGTSGQGNTGGNGGGSGFPNEGTGGGGGAGAVGGNGSSAGGGTGGNGGVGVSTYSSWGSATRTGQNVSGTYYYAGGGAGWGRTVASSGGYGGGGGPSSELVQPNATANTGGGGGGVNGAGGSGIVIVRYAK